MSYKQRARGVRGVRGVHRAARELPDQPGVHGPEQDVAAARHRRQLGVTIENPSYFGAREVGVEQQARLAPHLGLAALAPQSLADGGVLPALPDDRGVHRLPRRAIPQDRGLPLVGDADRLEFAGRHVRSPQGLTHDAKARVPDLVGLLLHPARLRKLRRDLGVCASKDSSLSRQNERRAARGALVDGENDFRHGPRSSLFS